MFETSSSGPEGGKARRVYLSLRDEIASGRRTSGEALPGEQALAKSFDVSRVTVRKALDALSSEGLIERRAGSGTRVAAAQTGASIAMDFTTLMPQVAQMGASTTARLLSFSYAAAPEGVAREMGVETGARMQIATRVRLSGGVPFSHLTTYVPEAIANNYSEHDLATTPLFKLLERSGVQIEEAHQTVSATLASPDVAEALGTGVGSALISLHRVVRDEAGRGVEYLSALYRPDMFRLDMDLSRVGTGSQRHWEPKIGTQSEAE